MAKKRLTSKRLQGVDDIYISSTGKSIVIVNVWTSGKSGRLYSKKEYYPATPENIRMAKRFFGYIERR